jgi:hypothetical protein
MKGLNTRKNPTVNRTKFFTKQICLTSAQSKVVFGRVHKLFEYWHKEKRTLAYFRRGPLGSHFDDFTAYLKAKGFSIRWGSEVPGKCSPFNAFPIDQGITTCAQRIVNGP